MEAHGCAVAVLGNTVRRAWHLLSVLLPLPEGRPWVDRSTGRYGDGRVSSHRPDWPTGVGLHRGSYRLTKAGARDPLDRDGAWFCGVLVCGKIRHAFVGVGRLCRVLHQPDPAGDGAWPWPVVSLKQLALRVGAGVRLGRILGDLFWIPVPSRRGENGVGRLQHGTVVSLFGGDHPTDHGHGVFHPEPGSDPRKGGAGFVAASVR